MSNTPGEIPGGHDESATFTWEGRLEEVRGVHSLETALPGVRRYSGLFHPRKIGRLTAPNSKAMRS